MKRITVLIIGSMLLTIQAVAQIEKKKDITIRDKKQTINRELLNIPIQSIGIENKALQPDYPSVKSGMDSTAFHGIDLRVTSVNYNNSGIFPFHKRMFFYLEGGQKQYLNLASYNLAYMALGFRLNSKLNLTGGILAIKQFVNYVPYGIDRSGLRFNLNYVITNQLDFNMWGQYLIGSSMNSYVDYLLPQTGTGASMVLNFGGGSQFGVGVEYLYDEKKEKWNYQSGGKLKLNF